MKQYIAYDKMSKKQKRDIDRKRRGNWGGLKPTTRVVPNKTIYNRKQALQWKTDDHAGLLFFAACEKPGSKTASEEQKCFDRACV